MFRAHPNPEMRWIHEMSGWSLVVTVPHRERSVIRMLAAFALPHHLFCELRSHVWRGRIIERRHPVFPGYIFAKTQGMWDAVRSISGVLGFVRLGERIAMVEDKIVDQLVRASTDDVLPTYATPHVSRFSAGDRVRVQGTGLWAGKQGIFSRLLVETNALIEIDIFGRWVKIPVEERDLEFDQPRKKRRRRRRHRSERTAFALAA